MALDKDLLGLIVNLTDQLQRVDRFVSFAHHQIRYIG